MKMRDGLTLAGVIAGLLAVMPIAASQAQMSLPGSFEVSDTGAATYTIPIAVPPGTAEMQPSLSLNYSSQSGNGLLGMGWSLSGLPTVTRCPKTIAQDAAVGGINYDANDRFCLEGQRLLAISGVYGADQTEYRTERESFSKIVSYGSAGTGPAWFKVWSKSGQVMEFGNTADSRIEAQGKSTVRLWAANKISDTKGNYIAISYAEDNANGEYRPTRIDYTGNSGAGISPFASVRFVYATRSDPLQLNEAGSLIKTTQRLANVQSFVGETLIHDYRLVYDISPATQRSRVASVSLCDAGNTCLPATSVAWSGAANDTFLLSSQNLINNFGLPSQFTMIGGDFDGDGKSDFAMVGGSTVYVHRSNGDGTFIISSQNLINNFGLPTQFRLIAGDFNGDGKADFAFLGANTLYVHISNGDGTFAISSQNLINNFGLPSQFTPIIGDFNGDGKTDFAMLGGSTLYVHLGNGDGTFAISSQNVVNNFGQPTQFMPVMGDFNGDGRSDFAMLGASTLYVHLSNGDGTFAISSQNLINNFGLPTQFQAAVGDFNGDGKTDFAMVGGTTAYIHLGKGDGTFTISSQNIINDFGLPSQFTLVDGDFNGDGRSDFALTGSNMLYLHTGNGDGTFAISSQNIINNFGLPTQFTLIGGDFNGDGRSDFGFLGSNMLYLFQRTPGAPDLATSIASGLGAVTTIAYKPITDATVYTKGTGAAYPVTDLQGPIYAVAEVLTSDGLGGNYRSTYKYAGARSHVQGRGFLGFESVTAKDEQTLVDQLTTYLQPHPYTGLVASRVKKLGATTLNETVNIYGSNDLGSGRSFVFLLQSVEKSWELNGSLVSQVTTTHQYDAYGNATQVAVATPDGYSKTTTNTYANDTLNWLLGRLTRASVTSVTP